MARFYGTIGYGESVETELGVYEDVIVEKKYYGDVLRNTRVLEDREYLHDDINVSNSISILADAYAYEHFFNIKYVEWCKKRWNVKDVEVQHPRLILRIGGIYNGPEG